MLAAKIAKFLVLHTDFGQWGGNLWRVKGWIFSIRGGGDIIHFLASRGDLPILPQGEQRVLKQIETDIIDTIIYL